MDWTKLIGAGLGYFGATGAARGQASAAKAAAEEEQRRYEYGTEEDKRRYEARKAAYDDMINRSKGDFGAGETAFTQEATQALPELKMMEQQVTDQGTAAQQDASKQIQSNLAQQGVRGGQAATQLRRATGDITKGTLQNINKMKFDEASQRAGERRQYQAGKAARGQSSSYTPPAF